MNPFRCGQWLLVSLFAFAFCIPSARSAPLRVADIVEETKIERGVVLVVGDRLDIAIELAETGRYLVHLLVPADSVESHRKELAARGLGGRIVVGAFSSNERLPHPDRFVNLAIADLDEKETPSFEEIQRVLAIRSKAYLRQAGKWNVHAKERSEKIDGWFAHWYNATGNCVSSDRVAGFPRAIQWQHGPMMEDGTADGKIPRIAEGKALFFDNQTGDLICRDAGNGFFLWRRFVGSRQNSDLSITAERIHLWYDATRQREPRDKGTEQGYLTAFDLETGKMVQTYEQGLRAGTAKSVEAPWRGRVQKISPVPWFVVTEELVVQAYGARLVVLDRVSGRPLWKKTLEEATWFSPVVSKDHVLVAETLVPAKRGRNNGSDRVRAVSAFAKTTGKLLWRNEEVHPLRTAKENDRALQARASFKTMSVADGLVLLHISSYQFREGGSITLLDEKTGRQLWRREFEAKQLYTQGSQRAVIRKGEVVVLDGTGIYRFSAETGKPIGTPIQRSRKQRRTGRANGACTASRATVHWLMANGWLYVGPEGKGQISQAARGACGQGVVPAHGLLFVPPTPCDCGDYLRGYLALAPLVPGQPLAENERWIRGVPAPEVLSPDADWPIFLGTPQRTSFASSALKGSLEQVWQVRPISLRMDAVTADRQQSERYRGALSAPVVGEEHVVVSALEQHRILALDKETGKLCWSYATGGKVDSPPTLAKGLAVFGCDDGSITALRLQDGKRVWTYRAAPTDGLALQHGHLGSAYPIPGSVLILDDTVIALAGAHTDLGGLHVFALDLQSGKLRAKRTLSTGAPPALANNLTVANAKRTGFWIVSPKGGSYGAGGSYHLSLDLKDLPLDEDDSYPAMSFDRQGSRLRFRTNRGRGGSTHGWKGAMRGNAFHRLSAHRVALGEDLGIGLNDPSERTRTVLWATRARDKNTEPLWQKSASDLDKIESLSALVLAQNRFVLGGGSRDGTKGKLFVLDATSGEVTQTIPLPARVAECGLAVAKGRLYVCCENGTILCLRAQ